MLVPSRQEWVCALKLGDAIPYRVTDSVITLWSCAVLGGEGACVGILGHCTYLEGIGCNCSPRSSWKLALNIKSFPLKSTCLWYNCCLEFILSLKEHFHLLCSGCFGFSPSMISCLGEVGFLDVDSLPVKERSNGKPGTRRGAVLFPIVHIF